MKVTILGCGGSTGVPMIGGRWGRCDPAEPRNRRLRPSILVQKDDTRVLVDTGPDLREQLLTAGIDRIDGVLYTHEHADHVHGIDELRALWRLNDHRLIDVFATPDHLQRIRSRFAYLFRGLEGIADDLYRPILMPHEVQDEAFGLGGFAEIVPFVQDHGICLSTGYRFGDFAYSTDVVRLPDAAIAALQGVKLWVVDCLRYGNPHPTHANLDTVLDWVDRIAPQRTVLTHMGTEADYATLAAMCPKGVEPGYDGMELEIH